MAIFSKLSEERLATCAMPLQELFHFVIQNYDCSVLEGYRDELRQTEAYQSGNSKLMWPHSKHNRNPSQAVDVVPYPIDWDDIIRFREFGHYVLGVADVLGIKIRWGGQFPTWKDYPHFELIDIDRSV